MASLRGARRYISAAAKLVDGPSPPIWELPPGRLPFAELSTQTHRMMRQGHFASEDRPISIRKPDMVFSALVAAGLALLALTAYVPGGRHGVADPRAHAEALTPGALSRLAARMDPAA